MLGTDLCSELRSDNSVIGLDNRPQAEGKKPRFSFIWCDITDRKNLTKLIKETKPDLIVHAAAWADVDGCEINPDKANRINAYGTENLAACCSDLNIPIIYLSTDFVFDGNKKSPYTETDMPSPLGAYGKSKLEGEKALSILKKYIIARTSWLFGKHGKNFVDTVLMKAQKEKEIRIVDDQVGSPTYTKDLAKAIHRMIRITMDDGRWTMDDIGGIYHVSNKGEVSWFDYAKKIFEIAGIRDVKVSPIKSSELDRPAKRPAFSVLDNKKFENLCGYKMRGWQEALKEYLGEKR